MKNATPAGVRADKGHTGRSLFELAPLHAPVLKNISGVKGGGGRRSCGSGNTPKTKSTEGIRAACPQETQKNIKTGHEIFRTTPVAKALASHGDLL